MQKLDISWDVYCKLISAHLHINLLTYAGKKKMVKADKVRSISCKV